MTPELEESMHTTGAVDGSTGHTLAPVVEPSLGDVLDAAKEVALQQLEDRPYATIAVAAVAGYVLGVATPKWVLNLAFTFGTRIATGKLVAALT